MLKSLKFLLIIFVSLFSIFFLFGFLLYLVYNLYKRYEKEIVNALKKYPEVSTMLRDVASFASSIKMKEDMFIPRTREIEKATKNTNNNKLNLRQKKILNLLLEVKKIEMSNLKSEFINVTERTLRRDLSKLESEGLIKKSGKTKGSSYQLV